MFPSARVEKRYRGLAFVDTTDYYQFYRSWWWLCPGWVIILPNPDDATLSVRQWRFQFEHYKFELRAYRTAVLAVALSYRAE